MRYLISSDSNTYPDISVILLGLNPPQYMNLKVYEPLSDNVAKSRMNEDATFDSQARVIGNL